MNIFKKAAALTITAGMLLSSVSFGAAAEGSGLESPKGIAIIHTNDVHCGIDANGSTFGYSDVSAYRAKLEAEGYDTLLVDAGDFIQGDVIGSLSKGDYLIDIMNEIGYDAAALGNHEFDYGTEHLKELSEKADFDFLSSNFVDLKTGNTVFKSYVIKEVGGKKIGIVGTTTPKTISGSNPIYFRDENGEYIYGFSEKTFYETVQASVDAARAEGADNVIVLSHLGVYESETTHTSYELIENTTGIDVVLDGHSHTVNDNESIKNKDGKSVILASTGTKLANIGTVKIENGEISAKLVKISDYTVSDDPDSDEYKAYASAAAYISGVESSYKALIGTTVASTDYALIADDPKTEGDRIVRYRETNLGDLCADAYRIVLGADVGIANGGGIRKNIPAGSITYGDIIAIHPYGNEMCVAKATGQDILDALEVGVSKYPLPSGAFLQVSGIEYELHSYIPSSVIFDENDQFVSVDGEYRVKNVKINGEPIELEKTYTVASHNFILKSGGSGLSMFIGNELIMDGVMLDNELLIEYMKNILGGVVGEEYSDMYGSGRIKVLTEAPASNPEESDPESTPESEPESTPESTPESEPESTPESEPESKPESTPESEPESTPESEPVPGASSGGNPPTGGGFAAAEATVCFISAATLLALYLNKRSKASDK